MFFTRKYHMRQPFQIFANKCVSENIVCGHLCLSERFVWMLIKTCEAKLIALSKKGTLLVMFCTYQINHNSVKKTTDHLHCVQKYTPQRVELKMFLVKKSAFFSQRLGKKLLRLGLQGEGGEKHARQRTRKITCVFVFLTVFISVGACMSLKVP